MNIKEIKNLTHAEFKELRSAAPPRLNLPAPVSL
jgi:hypothetical protein